MQTPCDICIEEDCKGKHSCNCNTCKLSGKCPRFLHPYIRITTKCTQACSHCCYSCSPTKNVMMSVQTAQDVKEFLDNNNIDVITLTGGEFFCNSEWADIFELLIPNRNYVRLITNGDWAAETAFGMKVVEILSGYNNLKVSISEDKWHNVKNVKNAVKLCKQAHINYNTGKYIDTEASIVPVGRADMLFSGMYSMFATYCSNPIKRYLFMIDEIGDIFKCPFGIWDFDNIKTYIEGGFAPRFKEVGQLFHKTFISNCYRCNMMYEFNPKRLNATNK